MRTALSTEEFVELLIEIDALQRLYSVWTSGDSEGIEEDERSVRHEVLESLLNKKLELRDHALAEFKVLYPELKKFDWAGSHYDA